MAPATALRRVLAALLAAALGGVHPGAVCAVPPAAVIAGRAVSAAPIGPAEPTEVATRCARSAGPPADPGALPAGHLLLEISRAWQFSRGAGVTVAVIDTGVQPNSRLPRLIPGGDYVSAGDGRTDCDLHGTLVAGIVAARPSGSDGFAGVAPEAAVLTIRQSSGAYRVKDARSGDREAPVVGAGYGPLPTLAKAIVRALDLGASVITVAETACAPAGSAIDDAAVSSALADARRRDAVVVAAAGNLSDASGCREQNPAAASSPEQEWEQVATVATPARFGRDILTVGAVDARTGEPAEFSLRGPWLSVAAPGTEIVSVSRSGLVDALTGDGDGDGQPGRRPLAGTSYAAAYAAGVAALVRARFPELSAGEVIERIVRTSRGGPDRDAAVGFGVVDPVAALTAVLPPAAGLPDPAAGRSVVAPSPPADPPAVAGVLAGVGGICAALLLAVWALTRRRGRAR